MAAEKSTGYYWDVEKWKGSRSVQRMSFAEQGVYRAMLDEQWEHRSLPDDPEQVADRIAVTETQRVEVLAAWPVVRPKFVAAEKGPLRIYNVALERTRRQQRANRKKWSEAGRVAGKASARKRQETRALHVNDRSTIVQRSSTIRQDKTETRQDLTRPDGSLAVNGRSKRPIFTGQRFVVFEWQLEDLTRLLGAHTHAFDLHEWFFALDADVLRTGEVVPQRDGGQWLQARTLAEATRRGMVTAPAPTLGKQSTRLLSAVSSLSDRR